METLGPQRVDVLGMYTLTLKDSAGSIVDLSGVASVAAVLSAGPGSPASATLAASVLSPATDGMVSLSVPPSAVSGLAPGTYSLFVTGTDSDANPIDFALDYAVALEGGVGTATTPGRSRSTLERLIASDCGPLMEAVGLSTLSAGANPDLDGPIGWGYRTLGYTPDSGVSPSDSEIDGLGPAFHDLFDLASYRVLVACRNRWTRTRIQVGANSLYLSDLRDSLDRRLKELESSLKSRFGLGLSSLSGGSIRLVPADADDDCDEFASRRWCR